MRLSLTLLLSTLLTDVAVTGAAVGSEAGNSVARHVVPVRQHNEERDAKSAGEEYTQDLWKRRGGGGGGGRGGGGSSSGGSSSGGSSSGSGSGSSGGSGSSSGGSSSGGRGGSGSSSGSGTSSGGSSSGGGRTYSGATPRYGGGSVYSGGARTPYRSGSRSPAGITPFFLGAGIGALAFYPLIAWPHGAYFYPYAHPYGFYNHSSGRNESKPVQCACDPAVECGCDDDGTNTTTTVLNEMIGDGDPNKLNKTEVMVANNTIFINGTLPNGTSVSDGSDSAGAGVRFLLENVGWWPVVATVCAAVFI